MRLCYRDMPVVIRMPVLAVFALLLALPSWGSDVHETKEAVMARPAGADGHSGSVDVDLAAARAAVSQDPMSAPLRVRLGHLLLRKGDLDGAMNSFDEALRLNPRSGGAKTGRGMVLARQGRLAEAEQTLKEALFLNPNPVLTHYELGLVYEKEGDLDKAILEFKVGIRKHEQGR